jgi:uncharacterized protein (TIGR04255 family)
MSNKRLPKFDNPPVAEVLAGIQFQPLKGLTSPIVGALWEKFKPDYSRVQQVAPLPPMIETFKETSGGPTHEMISFDDVFGLPRTWFETTDRNGLIQVQRDRFLHNWRKENGTHKYPHYHYVIANFRRHLETFESFLEENSLGPIRPTQYEMIYLNHIYRGEGWQTFDDLGDVLQDFFRRKGDRRFLPEPEIVHWQTGFTLPERIGRLHVSIRLGKTDELSALLLEITARGIPPDQSPSSMWSWFNTAHEWIVSSFADLTTPEIQTKVWKRKW